MLQNLDYKYLKLQFVQPRGLRHLAVTVKTLPGVVYTTNLMYSTILNCQNIHKQVFDLIGNINCDKNLL